ncbi:MAG: hypothetical protein KIT69_00400 [Propionibacteriaceae bacterium]|nr:hypothetical protein [Propionibacteriaceae bacterium]
MALGPWMIEVEGRRTRDVAQSLGLTPNATAALTLRARDAESGLAAAARRPPAGGSPLSMGAGPHERISVRGSLSELQKQRVRSHLDRCGDCDRVRHRVSHLAVSLRVAALVAGGSTAGLTGWALSPAPPAAAATVAPAGTGVTAAVRAFGRAARRVPSITVAVGVAATAVVVTAAALGSASAEPRTQAALATEVVMRTDAVTPATIIPEPLVPIDRPTDDPEPSVEPTSPAKPVSNEPEPLASPQAPAVSPREPVASPQVPAASPREPTASPQAPTDDRAPEPSPPSSPGVEPAEEGLSDPAPDGEPVPTEPVGADPTEPPIPVPGSEPGIAPEPEPSPHPVEPPAADPAPGCATGWHPHFPTWCWPHWKVIDAGTDDRDPSTR